MSEVEAAVAEASRLVSMLTKGMKVGRRDTVIIRIASTNSAQFCRVVYYFAKAAFPRNKVVVTFAENFAAVTRATEEADDERAAREREWAAKLGGDRA